MKLKRIVRYRVYYDRSGAYLNYVKSLIIIAMAYKLYEDSKVGIWMSKHLALVIPLLVIGYVILRLVIGYVDKKLKIREYEIEEYNQTDPNLRMIQEHLIHIKKKIDDNSTDSEHSEKG